MTKALVKEAIAPLYCDPVRGSELDDEALYGMTLEILEKGADDFYRVRTPYRYESWCPGEYLCFDEAEVLRCETGKYMLVSSPTRDVLSQAKVQGGNLKTLTRGALIEVLDDESDWVKVRLIGGQEGFVRRAHLTRYIPAWTAGEESFRAAVTAWAKRFLGTQYRWGGRTPLGIDCSGLCSECYRLCGVAIYRNAAIREGFPLRSIPRASIKPGDLLFFKGHVAMYLGAGKYIHSTGRAGSDGVVINSLSPADADYREDLDTGLLDCGTIF